MAKEEVNTLEHPEDDNKNTETDVINEPNQPEETIQSKDTDDIPDDVINSLDDDQFYEYMETGKLPKDFKVSKPVEKEVIEKETDNKLPLKEEQITPIKVDTPKEDTSEKVTPTKEEIDYESVYKSIFNGFKANGKEIKPRTAEDVITLMQQGANYTKKMQTMAPMRKTIESLNKASINDTDLNFLIDIHNGDKEAIKKLLAKHKVDPLDLNMDETNYVPKNNMVSDEDVEYSNVLDEIQSSLPKIQEIISKQWDTKSKETLLKDQSLLIKLHQEIEMGRFDSIQSQLELEKTFGRYKGISDLDAYIDIVSKMVAEQQNKPTPIPDTKPANTPKKDIPDKKGAAPNKAAKASPGSTSLTAKDIFSMSDEEFSKLSKSDLY